MMVENFSGKWIAANTPIVGADVFTQTAGIHADGDLKGDLYKSTLSPERFARKHSYALGKMSGKASLTNNLDELGIQLSDEEKTKVLERVVQLGDSKQDPKRDPKRDPTRWDPTDGTPRIILWQADAKADCITSAAANAWWEGQASEVK